MAETKKRTEHRHGTVRKTERKAVNYIKAVVGSVQNKTLKHVFYPFRTPHEAKLAVQRVLTEMPAAAHSVWAPEAGGPFHQIGQVAPVDGCDCATCESTREKTA